MKNEMMKSEMSSVRSQRLRLPLQTAPVERTLAATTALSVQGGVDPSGWFDSIVDAVKTYGPTVARAAQMFV
jgi:hypothetical protein